MIRIILSAGLAVGIMTLLSSPLWIKFEEKPKRPLWLAFWIAFGLGLSLFMVSFANWFIEFFGKLTPEQFLFNLQSPVKGTAGEVVQSIYTGPVLVTILGELFVIIYLMVTRKRRLPSGEQKGFGSRLRHLLWKKWFSALLVLVCLAGSAGYAVNQLQLHRVAAAYYSSSSYIEDHYVDIRNIKTTFPEKKRNLIHIYLESVENSYFDQALGGYMEQNLMPELAELSKEGISFSHQEKMGGPYQSYGSAWSVAAMVNMTGGVPLKVAMERNAYGLDGYFLPGLYNLGNYLHDNGYEQTIMFGADADFGGLTAFFKTHGDFHIFDHKYALENKLIPEGYDVWWGFEDDKLYEFAKAEITRLAATGKPFNFMMENADTHFPHGYLSKNAPQPYQDQYANVIAYSTSEVVKLVRWIQQQDFYENTTVVLTGDHLSMDKDFFRNFDPKYRRSVYNLFLNAHSRSDEKSCICTVGFLSDHRRSHGNPD